MPCRFHAVRASLSGYCPPLSIRRLWPSVQECPPNNAIGPVSLKKRHAWNGVFDLQLVTLPFCEPDASSPAHQSPRADREMGPSLTRPAGTQQGSEGANPPVVVGP